MNDVILEVGLVDDVRKPTENDIARRGPRRLVKLVPLPGTYAAPAIWTGPVVEDDIDGKLVPVRHCIVLISKEPKPETMRITIPVDYYDKMVDVPVEW
jgi:hypothetical protein